MVTIETNTKIRFLGAARTIKEKLYVLRKKIIS